MFEFKKEYVYPEDEKLNKGADMFFVTGHGRSGTVFLSDLFTKSENGHVFHESPHLDQDEFIEAFHGKTEFSIARMDLIKTRQSQQPDKIYGEVNGYLRYWSPYLLTLTPHVFHLVRDGKKVVRSMMNRSKNSFTITDKRRTRFIYPLEGDLYQDQWAEMDRFERLCWYWQHATSKLIREKIPIIQFEQILRSYTYLQSNLLDFIGIKLDRDVWNYERRVLKNETIPQKKVFPRYDEWTDKQKASFIRICGYVMEECGYDI